jgi:hypothetical protein
MAPVTRTPDTLAPMSSATGTTDPAADEPPAGGPGPVAGPDRRPRPLIERIGMAAIALVLAALFAIVAVASFAGGEPFLGVMGAIGCLMVTWAGGRTLLRG